MLVITTVTSPVTKINPQNVLPVPKITANIPVVSEVKQTQQPSTINLSSTQPSKIKTEPIINEQPVKFENKKLPVDPNLVRFEDSIDFMNQKTVYYIDLPKAGGKISGRITGLCNGDIIGEYNGQTVDFAKTSDRKDLLGEVSGSCKVGFLPIPGHAKFYGEVSYSPNRISLTVDVERPFQGRYYTSLRN